MHTVIGLTPGCEKGVGPELLIRAIHKLCLPDVSFHWCGDRQSLDVACQRAGIDLLSNHSIRISFEEQPIEGCLLKRQARFLEIGVKLAQKGAIDALVTGPIDKACLANLPGSPKGQTEYLKLLAHPNSKPFMSFVGGPFMLSLLTTHVPIAALSQHISYQLVHEHIHAVANHGARILKKNLGDIRIGMLGLNPHAGEQGLLGHEEIEIMMPAIKEAQKVGLNISGPISADGFFAYFHEDCRPSFDIIIASFHDQGLIPYKLLTKGQAVNLTLGLTLPRTSPAHGTARDLAGKNRACAKSTEMAITTALNLCRP